MFLQKLRSPWGRILALICVGSFLSYALAANRRLLPSPADLLAQVQPIHCPPDATFHPPLAENQDLLNGDRPLSQLLPSGFNPQQVSILIEKQQQRFTLHLDRRPIKSYRVVFGEPSGDKRREGDRRTPEGMFQIRDKYPHELWSKFLWINYPNEQSWCKHRRSKQQGDIPWTSSIGGEVGIHGVPAGADDWIDRNLHWTLGCPSLKNRDVEEIYPVVSIGAIVEILP
ncbi:MAG: L,D-transpeptidase [Synechococcales bacterium]|nr:L,D-transpeptidase [Synechococcales bacterium]